MENVVTFLCALCFSFVFFVISLCYIKGDHKEHEGDTKGTKKYYYISAFPEFMRWNFHN